MEIFIKSSRYILGPVSQHFILKILDMSREWAVVGRPAWCHIFGEKKYRLVHRIPEPHTKGS